MEVREEASLRLMEVRGEACFSHGYMAYRTIICRNFTAVGRKDG